MMLHQKIKQQDYVSYPQCYHHEDNDYVIHINLIVFSDLEFDCPVYPLSLDPPSAQGKTQPKNPSGEKKIRNLGENHSEGEIRLPRTDRLDVRS